MKRVLAFGTFDIVHLGHIAYLHQARRRGDHLTVVVARDSTVANLKGHPPHFSQKERVRFLKELRLVDRVVLGNDGDRIEILRTLRPDVIVLGHDHEIDIPTLKRSLRASIGTPLPIVVRARAYRRSRYTSHILKGV